MNVTQSCSGRKKTLCRECLPMLVTVIVSVAVAAVAAMWLLQ